MCGNGFGAHTVLEEVFPPLRWLFRGIWLSDVSGAQRSSPHGARGRWERTLCRDAWTRLPWSGEQPWRSGSCRPCSADLGQREAAAGRTGNLSGANWLTEQKHLTVVYGFVKNFMYLFERQRQRRFSSAGSKAEAGSREISPGLPFPGAGQKPNHLNPFLLPPGS